MPDPFDPTANASALQAPSANLPVRGELACAALRALRELYDRLDAPGRQDELAAAEIFAAKMERCFCTDEHVAAWLNNGAISIRNDIHDKHDRALRPRPLR